MAERAPGRGTWVDEHDPVVDPIRYEILSGRPLVVLSSRCTLGRVREALLACGREADGLSVVMEGTLAVPERLSRASRRPDPSGFPSPRHERVLASLRDELADPALGKVGSGLGVLPVLDRREVLDGRRVVTVVRRRCIDGIGLEYALWLAREMGKASGPGRPGPLLALDPVEFGSEEFPEALLEGVRIEESRSGGMRLLVLDPVGRADFGDVMDAACRDRAGPAWAERLERLDAGFRVGGGPGFVHAEAGGRLVVAWVGAWMNKAMVAEVTADGACAGVEVVTRPGVAPLPTLARLVARRGLVGLGRDSGWGVTGMFDPVGLMLDGAGPDAPPPEVWRLVRPRLDVPLARAIGGSTAGEFVHRFLDDPARRGPRRDFVVTWPFVHDALFDAGLRARVDEGAETLPIVARFIGTTPAVARRLVGFRDGVGLAAAYMPGQAFAVGPVLSGIGHDRLPERGDAPGWQALFLTLRGLQDASTKTGFHDWSPGAVARLLRGVGRDGWARMAGDLECRSRVADVADVATALARWLGLVLGREVTPGAAMAILWAHGSLARLVRASGDWHEDEDLWEGPGGLPLDCAWPVPFDAVGLGDGWSVRAVADVRALVDEGRAGTDRDGLAGLSHCVGGYGRRCQEGHALILSLRHGGDGLKVVRVSTSELVPSADGTWSLGNRRYALAQHRGKGNGDPGREAKARLERLRGMLAAGEVPVREAALNRRKPAPAGDPDPEQALRLLPAWRRILPAPWSRMEPDAIRAALDALDGGAYAPEAA